mmetsp:Transcript_19775/g.46129  ORF Transcript_19775/g.46129 Transcript_19775/m.46129 type:complete len:227 (-) Transcript_19775:44-724(-)
MASHCTLHGAFVASRPLNISHRQGQAVEDVWDFRVRWNSDARLLIGSACENFDTLRANEGCVDASFAAEDLGALHCLCSSCRPKPSRSSILGSRRTGLSVAQAESDKTLKLLVIVAPEDPNLLRIMGVVAELHKTLGPIFGLGHHGNVHVRRAHPRWRLHHSSPGRRLLRLPCLCSLRQGPERTGSASKGLHAGAPSHGQGGKRENAKGPPPCRLHARWKIWLRGK